MKRKNIGDQLIRAMEEAIEYIQGKKLKLLFMKYKLSGNLFLYLNMRPTFLEDLPHEQ